MFLLNVCESGLNLLGYFYVLSHYIRCPSVTPLFCQHVQTSCLSHDGHTFLKRRGAAYRHIYDQVKPQRKRLDLKVAIVEFYSQSRKLTRSWNSELGLVLNCLCWEVSVFSQGGLWSLLHTLPPVKKDVKSCSVPIILWTRSPHSECLHCIISSRV